MNDRSLPEMTDLQALGPSGPFPTGSQERWFSHDGGPFRVLGLEEYGDELVALGTPAGEAEELVRRLVSCGAREMVWAHGHGGRRGHLYATWDVRVTATAIPAVAALREIVGVEVPLASAPIAALEAAPDVVTAYSQEVPERTLRFPSRFGPRWSRTLRLPAHLRLHATHAAYLSVAVEDVGATVVVTARTRAAVEDGAQELLGVLRRDLGERARRRGAGGAVVPPP